MPQLLVAQQEEPLPVEMPPLSQRRRKRKRKRKRLMSIWATSSAVMATEQIKYLPRGLGVVQLTQHLVDAL